MPATAFPSPVLPGKEGMPAQIGEQLTAHRGLKDFLRDGTLTMVRVYQMTTPAGDVVTTYQEADNIEQSFRTQVEGQSEVAQLLRDHVKNTHGIDITAGPLPQGEDWLDFYAPATPRHPGIAFSTPFAPGKTDVGRNLGRECRSRRAEWESYNRSLGITVHRGYIIPTPMGDFASVYFEAPDPAAANRAFAADQSAFGKYFKDQVEEAFGIDFNEPLPPIRTVFEAHRDSVAV
jgi:hypothetical protein